VAKEAITLMDGVRILPCPLGVFKAVSGAACALRSVP
jgi:hypothetical protein